MKVFADSEYYFADLMKHFADFEYYFADLMKHFAAQNGLGTRKNAIGS